MEYRVRVNVLSAAIVVALGVVVSLVTSTIVASRAYANRAKHLAQSQRDLTVKGYARVRVRSDTGVWTIGVSGEGLDMAAAYAVLGSGVERVRAFLQEQGFATEEIDLSAIDTTTHYRRVDGVQTRTVEGYTLDRWFTVSSPNVDRIARAAGEVTQLLKDNVRVVSTSPKYYYAKVADLKIRILGEASVDGLNRAREIAARSGCQVGEVRDARMGVIQITRPHSTHVTSSGVYDTDTIEKDVSVVVTLTYALAVP